jgi:hypothetical protein
MRSVRRVRKRLEEFCVREGSACRMTDTGYTDDGQILCAPMLVHPFLRLLDDELHAIGATRGRGRDVKSCTRIVGSEAAVARHSTAWCTDDVKQTRECQTPGLESAVLGIDFSLLPTS